MRDADGGADFWLQEAVARGLYEWPRLLIAGLPISQTGSHADMRPKGVRVSMFCACAGLGLVGGHSRHRRLQPAQGGALLSE
jgi:hypothetical protein